MKTPKLKLMSLMSKIKLLLFLSLSVGLDLFIVGAAYGIAEPIKQSVEVGAEAAMCDRIAPASVKIEIRLEQSSSDPFQWEETFIGQADELLIIYQDSPEYFPFELQQLELYGPDGAIIRGRFQPGYDLEPSEAGGDHHYLFRLTETGEYRLVFTTADVSSYSYLSEAEPELWNAWTNSRVNHFLRVRTASSYENLVLQADQRLRTDAEAALSLYSLAVNLCPDRPQPYMGRMAAHLALAAQELTKLNSLDELMQIEALFQTLDAESQNLVLQDIKQATENYVEMVE
ncbi:MAG: hypothetical protein AAFU53_16745, partial [Cyanobacteria bacterium J06632_3]